MPNIVKNRRGLISVEDSSRRCDGKLPGRFYGFSQCPADWLFATLIKYSPALVSYEEPISSEILTQLFPRQPITFDVVKEAL